MKKILITGGAGFIGSNACLQFSNSGYEIFIFDNMSRAGSEANLEWLHNQNAVKKTYKADVRDQTALIDAVKDCKPDAIIHLAAQVAVTTSVTNPREDFEINAEGTFNVLETIRLHSPETLLINASTNKVYGKMADLGIEEHETRYTYRDIDGIEEERPLDFYSPYGCSKGVADQYTIDYARVYGLKTVTCRQSCIYGPRQFGVEDQGWVAWFTIAAVLNKPLTVFGNGKQVRDLLHVSDLVRAYQLIIENPEKALGQSLNLGGGVSNILSLLELLEMLRSKTGKPIEVAFDTWRPGDQPVFICRTDNAKKYYGWQPEISVEQGVAELIDWVMQEKDLISDQLAKKQG